MRKWLSLLAELGKIRITVAVSLSTTLGYIMYSERLDGGIVVPVLGLWLLAMGSAALNHYQERDLDARMDRTRSRPIPSGRISAQRVLLIAFLWSALGAVLLYFSSGMLAMQLGLLALIWYNAIYTPLKQKTPFAVVPGSAIGAFPPMVGWVSAGGSLAHPKILMTAFFFFIWQIPHFWLLLQRYGNQYEKAGFPTLGKIYSDIQIRRITFIWTFAAALSALMIPAFGGTRYLLTGFVLFAGSALLVVQSRHQLKALANEATLRRSFLFINFFLLFVMLVLGTDALI
ncbi:MAG: protoheme IX farnesyltransferase [Bacteroidales bacterium]